MQKKLKKNVNKLQKTKNVNKLQKTKNVNKLQKTKNMKKVKKQHIFLCKRYKKKDFMQLYSVE